MPQEGKEKDNLGVIQENNACVMNFEFGLKGKMKNSGTT